jgi:hypothetical protein
MSELSRRKVIGATTLLGSYASTAGRFAWPAGPDERFDFTKRLDGWETISGTWGIEDVPGASRDGRALVQRATDNEYNVIVAPGGPYGDVDISVRFKPISGWEDASGGIVFRFSEGRYYLVRANATEDNFRLYYYDRRRHMLASASVMAPMLGEWHTLRVSASGDSLRGWLNGRPLINHRDSRFTSGRVGLWTKADSITAFDSLAITSKDAG